jgi:hypothetical protein
VHGGFACSKGSVIFLCACLNGKICMVVFTSNCTHEYICCMYQGHIWVDIKVSHLSRYPLEQVCMVKLHAARVLLFSWYMFEFWRMLTIFEGGAWRMLDNSYLFFVYLIMCGLHVFSCHTLMYPYPPMQTFIRRTFASVRTVFPQKI